MARTFGRVGVVGLGTMGAGIAEVFARAGCSVIGAEPAPEALARGRGHLERSTGRAVRRGRLSEQDQRAILDRVQLTTELTDLADVDLVVEAVPEQLDLKRAVFTTLDEVCRPEAILTTNTSSLSVTEIAGVTRRPERVVGMHFFNPAPVLQLVEVVSTVRTEPGLIDDISVLAARLGKRPVVVADRAGFVANALLFGYLNAAIAMVQTGFASRDDVDAAMTLGCGLPMGPLALLDLIGLDTSYGVLESMYAESRDRLVAPAPLLKQLVTAGLLGRKSGRGFYNYAAPGSPEVVADPASPGADESAVPARPVQRVAVVGAGPEAATFSARLADAGYDALLLPRPPTGVGGELADRELIVAVPGSDDAAGVDGEEGGSKLFAALDAACSPTAILADGSRFGSVATAAGATRRPSDVLGLRLVGPVIAPAPPTEGGRPAGVLEVAVTTATSPEALATARALGDRLGARAVVCRDRPGRIADALIFPYLNAAAGMVQEGYATPDDIDTAMRFGCGYPAGPVEMLDAVGLDVAVQVISRLFEQSREPGLAPAPLLRELVALGRRTLAP